MKNIIAYPVAFLLMFATSLHAQSPSIREIKEKIDHAQVIEKVFSNGLKFCDQLDGKNFYFEPRNRVLNIESYYRALENLTLKQVYNPEKKRPWNPQDAAEKREKVKQQAISDKAYCDLVANLPALENQLQELVKQSVVKSQ